MTNSLTANSVVNAASKQAPKLVAELAVATSSALRKLKATVGLLRQSDESDESALRDDPQLTVGAVEELELPDGSLIALFTDGLIEAGDRDIDAGIARLSGALGAAAAPLEDLCDAVIARLPPGPPQSSRAQRR